MTGTILKGIAGFYYVLCDDKLYECSARGILRKKGITPLVGDDVTMSISVDGAATIDDVLPRLNAFQRPPCANVDTMVLVAAAKDPSPDFYLLDRFTVMARAKGANVIICVNKNDLGSPDIIQGFKDSYDGVFPLYFVCGRTGEGVPALKEALKGCKAALSGPSGVGKSTLINRLSGKELSETGDISRKTTRGKNTTRHTELFHCDGFSIFDTPGFTSFDASDVNEDELQYCFPELKPYIGQCRFDDCRHINEPGCAVKAAVEAGHVHSDRYASYRKLHKDIIERKKY